MGSLYQYYPTTKIESHSWIGTSNTQLSYFIICHALLFPFFLKKESIMLINKKYFIFFCVLGLAVPENSLFAEE